MARKNLAPDAVQTGTPGRLEQPRDVDFTFGMERNGLPNLRQMQFKDPLG